MLTNRPSDALLDPDLDRERAAIAAAPDSPDAYLAIGRLYHRRQAFARATEALKRARSLGSDDPGIAFHLAGIAAASGAYLTATREYQLAARQIGGHVEWTFLAANAFWELGWPDAAMRLFRGLPASLPDWWAGVHHRTRALLAKHRQTVRETLPLLRSGEIGLRPGRDLLRALTGLGRLRLAARLAAWLEAAHPRDPRLTEERALLAFRMAGAEAGLAVMEAGVAAGISLDLTLAARLAMEGGDPARAMRVMATQPREAWSHGAWMQACRIMTFTEDVGGLSDLTRAWVARTDAFTTTPYSFALEGMRLAGRLPLLNAEAPAGPMLAAHVLHFWDTPQPPPDVLATLDTWRAMNPSLRQTILDTEGARAFLLAHHGDRALRCFDLCYHASMQSDYLRMLWLVTHGGLYADVDETCVASVAPLLAALEESDVVVVLAGTSPPYLNGCVLGARRGSPLLTVAAEEFTARMLAAADEGRRLDIWSDTGPGLLTRHVARALGRATTMAEARRVATLIPDLRRFARNDPELAYKHTVAGNWRLA